jgi:DNA-binding NarL/FixJ family response regulator
VVTAVIESAAFAGRRQWFPRQGRGAGRPAARDPGRRGGGGAAVPAGHRGLVSQFLSQQERAPLPVPGSLDGLTYREREVLALVAFGLSNDDIAEKLYLSPLTAKTHVNRAMTKLGVRDRAQLVVIAYQSGLVTPP